MKVSCLLIKLDDVCNDSAMNAELPRHVSQDVIVSRDSIRQIAVTAQANLKGTTFSAEAAAILADGHVTQTVTAANAAHKMAIDLSKTLRKKK